MKKYSLIRKKAIVTLFAIFCVCLSVFMFFNFTNAKLAKANAVNITVNGKSIDISSFETYPLASVRTQATNPGIRFATGIDEEIYNDLMDAVTGTSWSIKFGTIITYKSTADSATDFTKEELNKFSVNQGKVYVDSTNAKFLSEPIVNIDNKEFTAVLTVAERNFNKELTARGYMIVSDGTNEEIYYAKYEDFSRNVVEVAKTSIKNISAVKNTQSLETLQNYASYGEDGYNMSKTSNSGFIKPSSVTTSSITVESFGNRNDVYSFSQTNSSEAWASRIEPALLSPSLSWEDNNDGALNALSRQKALGLKYLKFDFYYKNTQKGNTDFSLYYPTSSGEHGIVNFKELTVSSANSDWSNYVKVYNQLGQETTTLANAEWYTVVVDISCNLEMNKNDKPQVAIVRNNTNFGTINSQYFDNVIFYRELPDTLKAPLNVTNNNGIFSWDTVDGAVSYNIKVDKYNNGTLTTKNLTSTANSIDLTAYGECEVSVQAIDNVGGTSSFSSISSNRTDVIVDFNSESSTSLIGSTTTITGWNSTVDRKDYNNDGMVEIDVKDTNKYQNFNIRPTAELDKTKDGIAIRFMVLTSGYSNKTFTFQLAGPSSGENYETTYNSVDVVVREWQTLVLPMDKVILDRSKDIVWPGNGHYEYGNVNRDKLYFTLRADSSQQGDQIATILIDDLSYVDFVAPETPTNAEFKDGVFTWDIVENATSYNVKVNQYHNGELTTTNLTANTNSIDLTQYGECEVSVQAVGLGGTSAYSNICSNRTDVIVDFNSADATSLISNSVTLSGTANATATVSRKNYNNDGMVEIDIKSYANYQFFSIKPTAEIDKERDGIAIRFKVIASGYSEDTKLTFQISGPSLVENTTTNDNSVDVTVGEWQELILPMDKVVLDRNKDIVWPGNAHYEYGNASREKLYFVLKAPDAQGTKTATILIDDISYIDIE